MEFYSVISIVLVILFFVSFYKLICFLEKKETEIKIKTQKTFYDKISSKVTNE